MGCLPYFFLESLSHVSTCAAIADPYPCTRVVFVEMIIEITPHFTKNPPLQTGSILNINRIVGFVHYLAVSEKEFIATSLGPRDFHLIGHGPTCATGRV